MVGFSKLLIQIAIFVCLETSQLFKFTKRLNENFLLVCWGSIKAIRMASRQRDNDEDLHLHILQNRMYAIYLIHKRAVRQNVYVAIALYILVNEYC